MQDYFIQFSCPCCCKRNMVTFMEKSLLHREKFITWTFCIVYTLYYIPTTFRGDWFHFEERCLATANKIFWGSKDVHSETRMRCNGFVYKHQLENQPPVKKMLAPYCLQKDGRQESWIHRKSVKASFRELTIITEYVEPLATKKIQLKT